MIGPETRGRRLTQPSRRLGGLLAIASTLLALATACTPSGQLPNPTSSQPPTQATDDTSASPEAGQSEFGDIDQLLKDIDDALSQADPSASGE
jgi:hypothetical protein